MIKNGTLFINLGISRLDGTRLMMGGLDNGGFGRATNFLEGRGLFGGPIVVDGEDRTFGGPVILITDAGPAGSFVRSPGGGTFGLTADEVAAPAPSGARKAAKASKKRGATSSAKKAARKSAAKKSASKKSTSKKSAAKKSGAKKAARKSAKKSAKKSGAKKSAGKGGSRKRASRKSTR